MRGKASLLLRVFSLLFLCLILASGYREQAFVRLVSLPGELFLAMEALERARELNPASPLPFILEGEFYLRRSLYDYAQKAFSIALEMGGGVRALTGLGDALLARGKAEEAIVRWHQALEINPYDPALRRRIGTALLKLGKLQAAAFHLEEASSPCLLALAIAPDDPSRAARLSKNCPGLEWFTSILISMPDEFFRLKELGRFYIALGEYGAARFALEKALKIWPETPEGWALLGYSLSRLGLDPSQAFAKSLALDYSFPPGHYFLGLHLLSRGDLEGARRELLYALSLEPSNPYFLTALAEVEIRRGNYQEAEEKLKRAVELAPGEPGFRLSLAELQIATLMRTDEEALENVRKVLELSPDAPRGWELVGIAHYHASRMDLAEFCLRRALELSPDSPRALYYLGLVYSLTGEKEKGQDLFRRLQAVAPSSIWAQKAYWAERR
ncbi:MAG: tetratricopeptide repeat protein [Anaerolineae bacterium]|nr:tetratricopeptide repeat protein [Anaerolineae bacterium]